METKEQEEQGSIDHLPIDDLLNEMIIQQRTKILTHVRNFHPRLTSEDILNPNDFPELMHDPIFNYEDGIVAGLLSAQMAIRAHLLRSPYPIKDAL